MCQAIEYSNAPFKFYGGGVYPSTFFLATGFHGFHVIVGTCFLIVCWFRARAGHFTPERHFGFEAAAWYWHFVDVVWLFLFSLHLLVGRQPGLSLADLPGGGVRRPRFLKRLCDAGARGADAASCSPGC